MVKSQFAGETLLLLHPTIVLEGGCQSPSPAGTSESNLRDISSGTMNEGVPFFHAIITAVLQVSLLVENSQNLFVLTNKSERRAALEGS